MLKYALAATVLSLTALSACTVNTAPPVVAAAPAPAPTVVTTPGPAPTAPTVVVPGHY